jgi:hypothetical protein
MRGVGAREAVGLLCYVDEVHEIGSSTECNVPRIKSTSRGRGGEDSSELTELCKSRPTGSLALALEYRGHQQL